MQTGAITSLFGEVAEKLGQSENEYARYVSDKNLQKKLLALYMQASVGDNISKQPGILDLQGRQKWEAWTELKGMNQKEAVQKFLELSVPLI